MEMKRFFRPYSLLMACMTVLLVSCSAPKTVATSSPAGEYIPKREFRGAWMQVVNGQYQHMTSAQQQQRLLEQLDALQQIGVNAIFFQVRPEADALYISNYEPWSRFLTGQQGRTPDVNWDPLQFMVDACHARGMELHAWINPYRASMKGLDKSALHYKHPYVRHPENFVEYDGMLLFNPALQVNRDYICTVATDIVRRYDVDGLHVDDYFYPYPAAGVSFPDDRDFANDPRGIGNKSDWRRDNVNLLIRQLSQSIRKVKPWVKFGVSPFGIYHNESTSAVLDAVPGSATRGLQNYDDLYADVLYWIHQGWIDYSIPQLYWQIGHSTADYATLIGWWADNAGGRPLFIGQDFERSLQYADPQSPDRNQLARKFLMQRSEPTSGYCWWYAEALRQYVADPARLAEIQSLTRATRLALQPLYPFIDNKAPGHVKNLSFIQTTDGPALLWKAPKFKNEMDRPVRYVVYRFSRGEKINLEDGTHIVGLTSNTYYTLSPESGASRYCYVVTALDRLQNESKEEKVDVTL